MTRPITRTDVHSLLTILVRAAALCLLVYALAYGAQLFVMAAQNEWHASYLLGIIGPAVLVIVAVLLWLFADVLLKLSLSRRDAPVFESDLAESQWQGIVFSGIGLWFVASELVALTHWLVRVLLARNHPDAELLDRWISPEELIAEPVAIAVSLTIGLLLLLRARGLVGLLARIRGYHRPFVADDRDPPPSRPER